MTSETAERLCFVFAGLSLVTYLLTATDTADVPGPLRAVFFFGWLASLIALIVLRRRGV